MIPDLFPRSRRGLHQRLCMRLCILRHTRNSLRATKRTRSRQSMRRSWHVGIRFCVQQAASSVHGLRPLER